MGGIGGEREITGDGRIIGGNEMMGSAGGKW